MPSQKLGRTFSLGRLDLDVSSLVRSVEGLRACLRAVVRSFVVCLWLLCRVAASVSPGFHGFVLTGTSQIVLLRLWRFATLLKKRAVFGCWSGLIVKRSVGDGLSSMALHYRGQPPARPPRHQSSLANPPHCPPPSVAHGGGDIHHPAPACTIAAASIVLISPSRKHHQVLRTP